ncbi:MAG: phosphohydrolase [Deltaproteobacteria bacterium]|nr:phosphohydrolase [Deltaproteobacteria bacterium]
MSRCPGQDMRNLTISYHPCPECGKPVEFFSDEMRLHCPHCRAWVHRDRAPSCIEWCKGAKECLGAELYAKLAGEIKKK